MEREKKDEYVNVMIILNKQKTNKQNINIDSVVPV